jgi:hypothetical protein
VRERLVAFVWEHQRASLPRVRAELDGSGAVPPVPAAGPAPDDARVFSGGGDGERRGAVFGGPDAAVSGPRR